MRFFVVTIVVLGACAAAAQEAPLKGAGEIAVVVKDLQDSAKSCGLDQAELRDAAVRPLSGSKIKLANERSTDPMAYFIEVGALQPTSSLCTGSIGISLWDRQSVTAHGTTQQRRIVYWSVNYDVAASSDNFAQLVKDKIGEATQRFIAQWSLDQK
jgi:hypothetical protein